MKRVLVGLGCALALVGCRESSPNVVRVAAAADLGPAFEELGRRFEQAGGGQVVFSFGSSGLLAKQVREGAPFDVFAAANVSFVDELVAAGACDGATARRYARGRIVIWTRPNARVAPPVSLEDLADPRFARIAIANPEHAPYGVAAKQALTGAGVWARVEPRVVYGENVRQTLQLCETGNADAAIVAESLVSSAARGARLAIDERLHGPITQALVVCRHGREAAGGRAFAALVSSEAGQAVLARNGFTRAEP